jgi:hypothetical protein
MHTYMYIYTCKEYQLLVNNQQVRMEETVRVGKGYLYTHMQNIQMYI